MIDAMKPYAEYKDSGVPSLGRMPEHWKVRRQRNVVQMLVSNVDKHTKEDEIPVRLCNYVDVYKNDRITDRLAFMRATASADEIERFRLQIGDVVITKDSEEWDDIGVPALVEHSAPDLVCGYHLAILRPRDGIVLGGYLLRALQSQGVASQLYVAANGVTQYGLSKDAIKSVVLPVPPLPEQSSIVRYFDIQDRRINRLIRDKRRLIDLLNEQKRVIIHRAVTRGLDPDVRLKPSGIDLLGDMPEHWQVVPLKRLVSTKITDGPHETPPWTDDGVYFMSAESMVDGHFDFNRRRGFIPQKLHEKYCQKCRPMRDDIFMCKSGSTTGKVAIVETDLEFSVWSPLALIRADRRRVLPQLLYIILQSRYLQRQVQDSWSYGTQPNLAMDAMEKLLILLPPLIDQHNLLTMLDEELRSIELVTEKARREIALIREYRTRLISDVVTGKLDVRGVELPAMDEAETLGDIDTVEDIETKVEDLIESEEVADADE